MKSREQITRERDSLLFLMQTENHGDDSGNECNAKAWAMYDALNWVLSKRYTEAPFKEIYERMKMWQRDHGQGNDVRRAQSKVPR